MHINWRRTGHMHWKTFIYSQSSCIMIRKEKEKPSPSYVSNRHPFHAQTYFFHMSPGLAGGSLAEPFLRSCLKFIPEHLIFTYDQQTNKTRFKIWAIDLKSRSLGSVSERIWIRVTGGLNFQRPCVNNIRGLSGCTNIFCALQNMYYNRIRLNRQ